MRKIYQLTEKKVRSWQEKKKSEVKNIYFDNNVRVSSKMKLLISITAGITSGGQAPVKIEKTDYLFRYYSVNFINSYFIILCFISFVLMLHVTNN